MSRNPSKASLAESSSQQLHGTGIRSGVISGGASTTLLSSSDGDETSSDVSDESDDSDSEESLGEEGLGLPEVLAKRGFDYASLFTTTARKLDNGSMQHLKSPLIESLFAYVPPVLRFVTADEKSTNFCLFVFIF